MARDVLAIIPARGGSKGIPKKNIVDLAGKPLIAYSIEVALACPSISRVVVSTDDEEIAAVARELGAEVPFLRPRTIAGDRALLGDAITHVTEELKLAEGYVPDAHCVLYPTHPFRTPRLLELLLARLFDGFRRVFTARAFRPSRESYLAMTAEGSLSPIYDAATNRAEGSHLAFRPYGVFAAEQLTPQPRESYVFHLTDPVTHTDIDTPADLRLAEAIIRSGRFDFSLR